MEWNKLTNTHIKQKIKIKITQQNIHIYYRHTHHIIYNISNQRNKGSDIEIDHKDKNKVLIGWRIENSDRMENLENIKI